MSVLTRYLSVSYLKNVGATAFIILAFALLFDLLDVSDDLIARQEGALIVFAHYLWLRAPSLLSETLPAAALIGGLFMVHGLSRNSEMVAVWAAGASRLEVMLRLLPAALLLAGLKLANDDLLVPRSIEQLRSWDVGSFKTAKLGLDNYAWLEHDGTILRVALDPDAPETQATDTQVPDPDAAVLIFHRDAQGTLSERMTARTIAVADNAWVLRDVVRQTGRGREWIEEVTLNPPISHARLQRLYHPPQELPLVELIDMVWHDGYGVVPSMRHKTWLYQRLVGAISPVLLGLLAFSIARRFDRRHGAFRFFVPGVGIGFGFVVANGLMIAAGEAGFLPIGLAAAMPLTVLALIVFSGPCYNANRGRRAQ